MTKRKQNNNSTSSNTETDSRNLSKPKSGHPLTGVWKCFEKDAPKGDSHWERTYLYSNELELNLNVSNFIDLCSSVFTNSKDHYENETVQ
ncbi:11497_t:CDS:2 [Scutellospora calospora]|uniref:11497_t:CDS:1 n=1 Tax=Scutellospora calospora TaxID=85575 RepID=A0ACA9KDP3_9GLOM|nr:11497_t:CDS:2 [Scutellospora calospora]